MYLIEDAKHKLVPDGRGRDMFRSLAVVFRPDGGQTTKASVGDLHDEEGRKLKIVEVAEVREGDGILGGQRGPEFVKGEWQLTKLYSAAPEPPADPTPDTTENYADMLEGYRQSAYDDEGASMNALIVALWEKVVEERSDAADALEVKRQAVKKRFPKP